MKNYKKNTQNTSFDVIVIGGGHAGIEAAYASARLGSKTLLISLKLDRIGHMPCNPAIGGIGKGHIVFEISAFGGIMPKLSTKTYLQARMLNTSKGPAVQGLRLQIDKHAYSTLSQAVLKETENLTLAEGMVEDLIIQQGTVVGIKTRDGIIYECSTIVITTGTFLNGLVHIGHTNFTAGRESEEASVNLSSYLKSLNLAMGRLKTGTPARLLKSSLDFSKMETQGSDDLGYLFEFEPHRVTPVLPCYITHTTEQTHNVIRKNAALSPIYTGAITGVPPRYCPSIEDKISRFPLKTTHHVFVEPEGLESNEMYPNGLSTSMPLTAQEEFLRTIPGFEKVELTRPGYAIEYDFVHPNQLKHTLEIKAAPGIFLAGQINGTTGYEEAAGQGLIAGINAHLTAHHKPPFVLNRHESYIGIMIDDLVSLGVDEPYRMFTSRAERRLILRQDNVFARLGKFAYELGLISKNRHEEIEQELMLVNDLTESLQKKHGKDITRLLSAGNTSDVLDLIKNFHPNLTERQITSLHANLLYAPYLKREEREIEKNIQYQSLTVPVDFDYRNISGLSTELTQKLIKYKPATIAQAMLIQGMTPAAISLLIFKVREAQW